MGLWQAKGCRRGGDGVSPETPRPQRRAHTPAAAPGL